jgi:hypothetical protein|tara:strand:- start:666 stop:818 length:153 start_codon:yes stop_codon:yes gene_type:complete
MKENKLGRKIANTWSNVRTRNRHHRTDRRIANKGVRKYAKLLIKIGEYDE